MDDRDGALLRLGEELKATGYCARSITPLTHQRVNARALPAGPPSLQDLFGWSRPFRSGDIPARLEALLDQAGMLRIDGPLRRSGVRFSSLGDQLYVHSAYPTQAADSVFFGPDTYRFARLIRDTLDQWRPVRPARIVDIGCGSGAGGLYAASLLADHAEVVLADINLEALRYSRINAALNGIARVTTVESDVFSAIEGKADLIVSNPPYLVDRQARLYRHGGGTLGTDLSIRIAEESIGRLAPGGKLVLYTGTPVMQGRDILFDALTASLATRGRKFAYDEIDPDVFGEELDHPPYDRADRIAAVGAIVDG